jgi:hypothetical protein
MGMNSSQVQNAVANGAIGAFRFVERDPGSLTKQRVNQGTANGRVVGVGPSYATTTGTALPYAYSGLEWLIIGVGGCTAGDRLKSDSTGQGVAISTGGTTVQNVGALATADAVAGDIILVQVEIYTVAAGDYLS